MRHPMIRHVTRALHAPLTVGGKLTPPVERRLFFGAAMTGAGVFSVISPMAWGLVCGIGTFLIGYGLALRARRDPVWLPSLVRAWRLWTLYDPGKHEPFEVDVCD